MTCASAPISIRTIPRFVVDPMTATADAGQLQVVEIVLDLDTPEFIGATEATVDVVGHGIRAEPLVVRFGASSRRSITTEVPVRVDAPRGSHVDITATLHVGHPDAAASPESVCPSSRLTAAARLRVAEPDTVIHLVPHFHMDPVWWNTQAASVSELDRSDWSASPRLGFQRSAFTTLASHLARAERDDQYRFCVAEVDYLRPFAERFPGERRRLQRLVHEGRIDVVGATHNEPNSNLTNLELTRRNLVEGLSFQRGVLGAPVTTAWQLDVFGHHPMFPSALHEAGVSAVALARGPYRAWGPMLTGGFSPPHHPVDMQMHSEVEWLSPDGRSATLTYLTGHYSTGWMIDGAPSISDAADRIVDHAGMLRAVAATRHVMVLVGTDLSPPARYLDELGEHVARRWSSPDVRCSTPTEFLTAVELDLADGERTLTPQSRDLNPVYTGKDVSYIDTKQAHRHVEQLVLQAETWSTLARGHQHDEQRDIDALDRAWRSLIYAAHHDALTGTESDQVYIDLLAGWREAHDLALEVRTRALTWIAAASHHGVRAHGVAVTIFNDHGADRTDVVRMDLDHHQLGPLSAHGLGVVDHVGRQVPHVVDHASFGDDGTLRAVSMTVGPLEVPGVGHRTVVVGPADELSVWHTVAVHDDRPIISNAAHRIVVDPTRGGCVTSWTDRRTGTELVAAGRLGNELLRWPEYPAHPELGEGPWHIAPCGAPVASGDHPADVTVERSQVGERLTTRGRLGTMPFRSSLTLWHDLDRIDGVIDLPDVTGHDTIVRVRWPCDVAGGLPIVECDGPVIGRGFAHVDVDAAETPWTLDNPAYGWFGIGSVAHIDMIDPDGHGSGRRAIGITEIVVDDPARMTTGERDLIVALARRGVTATVTGSQAPRYGALSIDSNLPDVRMVLTVADTPGFAADVLASSPAATSAVRRQLEHRGAARVVVPAVTPLRPTWTPTADLRDHTSLPVVVVLGVDAESLRGEIAAVVEELADGRLRATVAGQYPHESELLDDRTVAWVNVGTPGCAVDVSGAMHMSLLRQSTGWPADQWIDPPRRTVPDGTSFQSQHWSHRFVHALVAGGGGWRRSGAREAAAALHRPLVAVAEPVPQRTPPMPASADADVCLPVRLLSVEPASVRLTTVKRSGFGSTAGWPTRRSGHGRGDPARMPTVVVRCEETAGHDTVATVSLPGGIAAAALITFDELDNGIDLDIEADGSLRMPVSAWGAVTVRITADHLTGGSPPIPTNPSDLATLATPLTGAAPADRPVFSRYWVQNTGPVPLGGLPLAVHLHPPLDPSRPDPWRVTVALADTHCGPAVVALAVDVPEGWAGELRDTTVELQPGGHATVDLHMGVDPSSGEPVGLAAGFHLVRVVGRIVDVPVAAYDEHVLARSTRGSHIVMDDPVEPPPVHPGDRTHLLVRLTNRADRHTWGDLDIVSPWGSWELLPRGCLPVDLEPGIASEVRVPVEVPIDHPPGRWWILVRARVGDLVLYTDSVWLTVIGHPDPRPQS